jgi:integrase
MFGISPRRKPAGCQRPRKLIGQKPPLKLKEVWAIRMCLQLEGRLRDLALFNLAIDSKFRGCDVVSLSVQDVCQAGQVSSRAIVMPQKTGWPVRFEITEQTRVALTAWIHDQRLASSDYLFPSRVRSSPHISRRQYARLRAK